MNSGRYTHLFSSLTQSTTNELENDETEAAVFVCEIIKGDIPDAIEGLGQDVIDEITDDFEALTSFVKALPTIVPDVLSDIEKGGEEAVSIIEDLVTDPGAAITIIENGVKSVWSDVTNGVKSVLCDVGIGNCPSRTLAKSCNAILASASSASRNAPASTAATTTSQAKATTSATVQPASKPTSSASATPTSHSSFSSQVAVQSTLSTYATATATAPTTTVFGNSADILQIRTPVVVALLITLGLGFVIML